MSVRTPTGRGEGTRRARPSPETLGDLSPHPTSTPGQMKRQLLREWNLVPFSRSHLQAARDLVMIVSSTKSPPVRAKAKTLFANGMAALVDGRAARARECAAKKEKSQLEKAQRAKEKEREKNMEIGAARKAEKTAIAEREIAAKMAPVIMVGKRAASRAPAAGGSAAFYTRADATAGGDDEYDIIILEAVEVTKP